MIEKYPLIFSVKAWMACAKVAQPQARGEHTKKCSTTDYKCR